MAVQGYSDVRGAAHWPVSMAEELDRIGQFKKKVAIIRLWPDQAAAEHESIERFRAACSLIGVDVVEVDRLGFILNGPRRKIAQDDVDFVISLHYETAKTYDCFSWGALWNPVDFYVEWGLSPYLDNQLSHDGYFVCGSPAVERMMRGELGDSYEGTPFVQVNHTLSGPIVPARLRDDRRFAYCGINWERLSKAKGRFDALLTRLDERGVLDIFGPEEVRGVRVWEGFKGYKYSVPFDGRTLIEELSRSGAVLAFSSQAHIRSGIMSNRLFEGAAAGALVFADQNPFVSRYFKDEVVEVPLAADGQLDAGFLASALADFNANPEAAFAKASALQNKFVEFYALHRQLLGAFAAYKTARDAKVEKIAALSVETTPTLDAVVLALDENAPLPQDLLTDLVALKGVRTKVTLVTRASPAGPRAFDFLPEGAIELVSAPMAIGDSPNAIGFVLAEVLEGLDGDYVSVFLGHERVFADYGLRLTEALAEGDADAVRTGVVIRHYDPAQRLFEGSEYADYARPVGKRPVPLLTLANFMFRRKALIKASGAFQFMAWSGMQAYLQEKFAKPAVVDAPLCSADLKLYERLRSIGQQPYEAGKAVAVLARYTTPTVKALAEAAPAGMPITAAAIAALPEQERRDIIVSLLKTLPLPPWIIRGGGKIIRLVMGIRRPKR